MRASKKLLWLFFPGQFLKVLVDADDVGQEVVEAVFREDTPLEVGRYEAGFVGLEVFAPGPAFQIVRKAVDVDLHGLVGIEGGFQHPDSQIRFADVRIPFVQEAVDLAEKLHEKLSSIRVIGWDIAITSDGPVFIEGNDNPEISGLQTVNGGLKKDIVQILKNDF